MNKNLRILKWIYTEGLKENPMSYKELAEHCGVCSATIASVVRKLEAFGILKIPDKGKRNAEYKWISSVQPNESLAIRVGRTKLTTMNFTDFEDSRLIQELKSRGYVIFKEV
jgi:predicted transcriptional regulator